MKKFLKILTGILVFIAVVIGIVFFLTSGMTDNATAFFNEVKAKNYDAAYDYLSEDFKASTPKEDFVSFLDRSALINFKETSWGERSFSGNQGELDGSVITDNGGVIPIKIGFIKENDEWKIYSIFKPKAGLTEDNAAGKIPPADALMKLTDESLMAFASAVNAKDFTEFHSDISNLWQKQITAHELGEIFKAFTDGNINMVPALKTHNPVFDAEPLINSDGVMVLEGHYPTQPSKLLFTLKYIYEGVGWKLIGISVNIK